MVEAYVKFEDAEKLEIFDGNGNRVLTAGPITLDGQLIRSWFIAEGEGYMYFGERKPPGPCFHFDFVTGEFTHKGNLCFILPLHLRDAFYNTIESAIKTWAPLQDKYRLAFPTDEEMQLQQLHSVSGDEAQSFVQWLVVWKKDQLLDLYNQWKKVKK